MRVLGRIRLSRLTEESPSAARQREIIENWAAANDHEIVGWAEDIDVSGSVDPFEAPALREWWDRKDEWDILCAWKLDRIGRLGFQGNRLNLQIGVGELKHGREKKDGDRQRNYRPHHQR